MDPDLQLEAVRRVAERGLSDLRFFACDILHYDGTRPRDEKGNLMEPDFTDPAYDKAFDFAKHLDQIDAITQQARGTGKTTLFSQIRPMQRGLQDPNRRICLTHAKHDVACGWVQVIHDWMIEGPYNPDQNRYSELRDVYGIFGMLPPVGKKWGTEGFLEFPKRTMNFPEPTIMASGMDNIVTGLHFTEFVADDYINQQNYRSEGVMAKAAETWKLSRALMVQGGRRLLIGTRWNPKDVIGEELDKEEALKKSGRPPSKKVLFLPGRDEEGNPTFRHMGEPELKAIMQDMGPSLFAGQILLKPVADGVSPLKEEYFKKAFFRLPDVGTSVTSKSDGEERVIAFRAHPEFHVAIFVDLAASLRETADRTAIVVRAADPRGHIYILQAEAGRWPPGNDVLLRLFRLQRFYGAEYIGCERGPFRAAYEGYIRNWNAEHRGAPLLFNENIKVGGGKNRRIGSDRILSLEPWAANGQIHLLRDQTDLLMELCLYPNAPHDDLADAMALAVLNPYRVRIGERDEPDENETEVGRFMRMHMEKMQRRDREESFFDD